MNSKRIFQLFFMVIAVFLLGHTFYSTFYEPERVSPDMTSLDMAVDIPTSSDMKMGKNDPDSLMDQVDQVLQLTPGDHALAIRLLDQILSRYPGHSYAVRLKANLLSQSKRINESAKAHLQYLQLNPDDMRARFSYGKQLFTLKRWTEAIAQFESVHNAYPTYAPALGQLSKSYRAVKDEEKAVEMEVLFQNLQALNVSKSLPLVIHQKYLFRKQERPVHRTINAPMEKG